MFRNNLERFLEKARIYNFKESEEINHFFEENIKRNGYYFDNYDGIDPFEDINNLQEFRKKTNILKLTNYLSNLDSEVSISDRNWNKKYKYINKKLENIDELISFYGLKLWFGEKKEMKLNFLKAHFLIHKTDDLKFLEELEVVLETFNQKPFIDYFLDEKNKIPNDIKVLLEELIDKKTSKIIFFKVIKLYNGLYNQNDWSYISFEHETNEEKKKRKEKLEFEKRIGFIEKEFNQYTLAILGEKLWPYFVEVYKALFSKKIEIEDSFDKSKMENLLFNYIINSLPKEIQLRIEKRRNELEESNSYDKVKIGINTELWFTKHNISDEFSRERDTPFDLLTNENEQLLKAIIKKYNL